MKKVCVMDSPGHVHLGRCAGPIGRHGRCLKHLDLTIEEERDELHETLEKVKRAQERLTSLRADRRALREKTT